jgi:hypothetical protein
VSGAARAPRQSLRVQLRRAQRQRPAAATWQPQWPEWQ